MNVLIFLSDENLTSQEVPRFSVGVLVLCNITSLEFGAPLHML